MLKWCSRLSSRYAPSLIMAMACLCALPVSAQVPGAKPELPQIESVAELPEERLPDRIDPAFRAIGELELRARIAVFDRMIAGPAAAPGAARILSPGQLSPAIEELMLNESLAAAYRESSAAVRADPAAGDRLISVALQHWMVLLRRAVGPALTTEVPDLRHDPDCTGDMLGADALPGYVNAVVLVKDENAISALHDNPLERQRQIIHSLGEVARIEACLSARQSALLAAGAFQAFGEVAQTLRDNGHAAAVDLLAGSLSAPLVLIHDVEKRRAPLSPLGMWFAENRAALVQLARHDRLPSSWHHLWLYDWRTGRMIGFSASRAPTSENEVALAEFFESITDAASLGDLSCSFSDMVQRGLTPVGYACVAGSCVPKKPEAGLARLDALAAFLDGLPRKGTAQLCRARPELSSTPTDPRCEARIAFAGIARDAAAIECLSSQLIDPGSIGLACFSEATGTCADPIDKFTKNINSTAMAGVKLSPGCRIGADDGGVQTPKTALERKNEALENAQKSKEQMTAEVEGRHQAGEITQEERDAQLAAVNAFYEAELADVETQYGGTEGDLNAAYDKVLKDNEAKYGPTVPGGGDAAAWAKADHDASVKFNQLKDDVSSGKSTWTEAAKQMNRPACSDSLGNCAPSTCSGLTEAVIRTLECVTRALNPDEQNPVAACDPQVCDDFDAGQPLPASAACVLALTEDPTAVLARQCWSVRCGPGMTPTVSGQGCLCVSEGELQGSSRLGDICQYVLCAEGAPQARGGTCECTESTGAVPGPKVSDPGFDLPVPLTINPPIIQIFGNGPMPPFP